MRVTREVAAKELRRPCEGLLIQPVWTEDAHVQLGAYIRNYSVRNSTFPLYKYFVRLPPYKPMDGE